MSKILLLYKIAKRSDNSYGDIFNLTQKYCNSNENIKTYFVVCDNSIDNIVKIDRQFIFVKMKENNYESLLIKVIRSFQILANDIEKIYSHVIISNISTFINIPLIYDYILNTFNTFNTLCSSFIGKYRYNSIEYNFASGACYIFKNTLALNILNYFTSNNYINDNNELSSDFIQNHPSTDDIAFGLYLYKNNISIKFLERFEFSTSNIPNNLPLCTHYRIKTNNYANDIKIHNYLFNLFYS
jgi:hypothetical protein